MDSMRTQANNAWSLLDDAYNLLLDLQAGKASKGRIAVMVARIKAEAERATCTISPAEYGELKGKVG